VLTRSPIIGQTTGALTGEIGNYNSVKLNGALNLPLGDKAAIRASFMTSNHDAYLSDGTDEEKGRAGRVRVKLLATPALTIQIGADYFHQGGKGGGSVLVRDGFIDERIGNSDPRAQAIYNQTLFFPAGSFLPALPNDARSNNRFWGVNGSIEWRNDVGTLTILPAFRRSNLDYRTGFPGLHVIEKTRDEQSSVEARFASNEAHPLRWLIGGYYLHENVHSALDYNSQFNLSHQRLSLPLTTLAAFGRLTYAVSDHVRLTGGVRFTRDRKTMNASGEIANILCFGALVGGNPFACAGTPGFPYSDVPPTAVAVAASSHFPVPYGARGAVVVATPVAFDEGRTFKKTTFRGGIEWDVAAHSLIYASVETGFKAGGFFFGNEKPSYRPETITAFTIGSKNRFIDNRLQLNLEGFYWKYRDQQVSHITRESTGAVVFATENVGRATIKGAEAEVVFAAMRNTIFAANAQYLDAKYDKFAYLTPNLGGPPVANCPFSPSSGSFLVNCSGRVAPQSPKWTLNLSAQQTIQLGAAGSLMLNVATKYQTRTFVGLEYLDSQRQRGYWMSNAQLTWSPHGDHLSLTAFVSNIEDAVVKTDAFPHPLVGAALVSSPLRPPRTYGLRATARF
jgi:iron complex outermembrane receptor protein